MFTRLLDVQGKLYATQAVNMLNSSKKTSLYLVSFDELGLKVEPYYSYIFTIVTIIVTIITTKRSCASGARACLEMWSCCPLSSAVRVNGSVTSPQVVGAVN